jgi:hypothetical protein
MKFEIEWLSHYPCLLHCIHDQRPEFTSFPFQHVLALNGIKEVSTPVADPQSNAINEHLHQTIENTMRTLLHTFQPQNPIEAVSMINNCYATTRYAAHSAVHHTLNVSPSFMVFILIWFCQFPSLLTSKSSVNIIKQLLMIINVTRTGTICFMAQCWR